MKTLVCRTTKYPAHDGACVDHAGAHCLEVGDVFLVRAPHCDMRVLHSPGSCEYCDKYPERQAIREANLIMFTDDDPRLKQGWTLCPALAERGVDSVNAWGGNRARAYV